MKKLLSKIAIAGTFAFVILACGSDSEEPTANLSSARRILELRFTNATGGVNLGTIDEESNEISLIVPESANLSALAPEISVSPGATISPASGSTQDFTNPVTYTVTAEDGSTETYTVVAASVIFPFTIEGKRYELVRVRMFWPDAAAFAVQRGGHLAEVNSGMEQGGIVTALEDSNVSANILSGPSEVWLGGSDINQDGIWIWDGDNDGVGEQFWMGGPDGMNVNDSFTNWGNIEPDGEESQNALSILVASSPLNEARQWNDRGEEFQTFFFIIEYED